MNEWMQGESEWEDCRSARHGPHDTDWDADEGEDSDGGENDE